MRTKSNAKLAKRCAMLLVAVSVAAWSLQALIDPSEKAQAQNLVQDPFQSGLHQQYAQFPIGNIETLFAHAR